MADTGLLTTAAFRSNVGDRKEMYQAILNGNMSVNKGMLFENMVSQELVAKGYELRFGKFYVGESTHAQEVDFLIADVGGVIPIDVKSSASTRHISLDRFMKKYRSCVKRGIVIHSKDLRVDGDVLYIPIYMTMFL